MNVGVAVTRHCDAKVRPRPTPMSILAKPAPFLTEPWDLTPLVWASSLNTGSIMRHGPHVELVKNATAALWVFKKERKEGSLVITCTAPDSESVACV